MNIKLENKHIIAKIKSKGAELFSVFNKNTQLEYMWNADPAYWGKTSPVLFPIVGTLKNDTFIYDNNKFGLSRHGFARDDTFDFDQKDKENVTFRLASNEATFKFYPFSFELFLHYGLKEDNLYVTYEVKNTDRKDILFSIGGHPAFKVPLTENTEYKDHYLLFDKSEDAGRWPLSRDGLIETEPRDLLKNTNKLTLTKELFYSDAIVLKHLKSHRISLRSEKHEHGLDFDFEGFPYLGIWAAKNADFVCIEPWCGIADHVDHNQQLEEKEGIQRASPGDSWARTWKVKFY